MKNTMRRVMSVVLVLVMVLSMTVTAFASETISFLKTDMYTGETTGEKTFSISAETVEKTGDIIADYDFGSEYEVIQCTGDVTVKVLDSNTQTFNVTKFDLSSLSCYGMMVPEGCSSLEQWAAKTDKSGYSYKLSAPGTYAIEYAEKDGFIWQYVLMVEEGSAGSNQGGATVNVPLSFSDIPPGHWAYDAIMEMVSINMFKGMTEPDANGVALFGESDPMTYVQFLAVMTRLLYPSVDEDYSFAAEEGWFMPYYYAALDFGLIEYNEVAVADLNKPMTREQMARVLVRSGILFGTVTGETGYTDFPDVDKVGDEYFEAVAIAYGEGLLCGVDAAGTFNPQGTLTRAQAAMVCYRLLDSSTRVLP